MKLFAQLVLLVAVIIPLAFANGQAKKTKKKSMADMGGSSVYGPAGCGLGSIVFGAQPGYIQIVAATLNAIGVQTFAMTTGTSNCDLGVAGGEAAVFIETNREIVMKDFSRGNGETVSSLAAILHCNDAQVFGQMMKDNYGKVLENGISAYESTRRIMNTIETNPELQNHCG